MHDNSISTSANFENVEYFRKQSFFHFFRFTFFE